MDYLRYRVIFDTSSTLADRVHQKYLLLVLLNNWFCFFIFFLFVLKNIPKSRLFWDNYLTILNVFSIIIASQINNEFYGAIQTR